MKREEKNSITCSECDISDLNCYEQCRGCFGASFYDCGICDDRKKENEAENDNEAEIEENE